MKNRLSLLISAAMGTCLLSGCASHKYAPMQSGFLTNYRHMRQVDDTTWRYVNAQRLATYTKFKIAAVEVLVKNYDGQPLTPEQHKKMTDYIRASITSALKDKYPVVDVPSAETAAIRVAITDGYKSGNRLGISVEGEIEDSYSPVQVAAVMRNDQGPAYIGDWWDKTSARQIVDGWSQRLRQVIDSVHAQ